jgi:hypothetical protein
METSFHATKKARNSPQFTVACVEGVGGEWDDWVGWSELE